MYIITTSIFTIILGIVLFYFGITDKNYYIAVLGFITEMLGSCTCVISIYDYCRRDTNDLEDNSDIIPTGHVVTYNATDNIILVPGIPISNIDRHIQQIVQTL